MTCRIVVVGTSLGGMRALQRLLTPLPADLSVPIAVVQHRAVETVGILRAVLQRGCPLKVREPQDKEPVKPGSVYVAPADYHLMVEENAFSLSTEGPVHYARPSIDVLFESAADSYGKEAVAVVLTGASDDGARGAAKIKERGGYLIVQDPATAECPVMPRAAIAATTPDKILPLEKIPALLVELCRS